MSSAAKLDEALGVDRAQDVKVVALELLAESGKSAGQGRPLNRR